jgi:hypothetical protein
MVESGGKWEKKGYKRVLFLSGGKYGVKAGQNKRVYGNVFR